MTSRTTSPTFATTSTTRAARVSAGCDTAFVMVTPSRLVFLRRRAIGAVVARFVHTEEVTGSNPVSPTLNTPAIAAVFSCLHSSRAIYVLCGGLGHRLRIDSEDGSG